MTSGKDVMREWRDSKKQAGYLSTTIWFKADVKHLMEDTASKLGKDLGEILTEAFIAWQPAAARKVMRTETQLEALIDAKIAAALQRHAQGTPAAPVAATISTPSTPPPQREEILPRIHSMKAQGLNSQEIAQALNAEGIRTLSGKGEWRDGTIRNLLKKGL